MILWIWFKIINDKNLLNDSEDVENDLPVATRMTVLGLDSEMPGNTHTWN